MIQQNWFNKRRSDQYTITDTITARKRFDLSSLAGPAAIGFTSILAVGLLAGFAGNGSILSLGFVADVDAPAAFTEPTKSSTIALDANKNLMWVVNPDDDKVTIIGNLDTTPSVIAQVNVGDEPQSIALDTDASPESYHAYVANAADNTVTIISVDNSTASSVTINSAKTTLTTGSEPWNVVASPDGKRVFVANAGQDTLSVIRTDNLTILGNVDLRDSVCNGTTAAERERHFQPHGLAVTLNNDRLFVTRLLSFVKPGGAQADDLGKEGVVCQLNIDTASTDITAYAPAAAIKIGALNTGFKIDKNKDGIADDTFAYPNQMRSVAIRGNQAYLPNIAASPSGPLRFNVDTQAFVSVLDNAATGVVTDTGAAKSINMHLGARTPEAGKKKLFFSNPWDIAFTNQSGAGNAYVVSSGSDLLVKLDVDASGVLSFTNGAATTRYIDLNDPNTPATQNEKSGKNPLGIVIRNGKAFVMNYVSRNVSVVDLASDAVTQVVQTSALPIAGSQDEQLHVGKEVFFSSRGHFVRPAGTTVSTDERLSSEGWQNCASCHFQGLTDGNVWAFGTGPRKSVPLNGTWSPINPDDQRMLNYSAIFDEVQDFEINIRNVSGPGPLITPTNGSLLDPNHGILISDTGDINTAPLVLNAFVKPNAGRSQLKIKLPGSNAEWPALDAMKEWVRFAVRTPNGLLTTAELSLGGGSTIGGLIPADVAQGKRLFFQSGCQACHGGSKWTISNKDFISPPAAADIATEAPVTTTVGAQFLPRFLKDINSFNLGVAGGPNLFGDNIGGVEKTDGGLNALGNDANADGKGKGYNVPSLLAIWHVPPYYHNGACETLACVLSNSTHRSKGLKTGQADPLATAANQAKVVAWLKTLDADTDVPSDLRVNNHDIFLDPPTVYKGLTATVGANIQLFGAKPDLADLLTDLGLPGVPVRIQVAPATGQSTFDVVVPAAAFRQDFGFAVISATWNVPANAGGLGVIRVTIDPDNQIFEDNENNNAATRRVILRNPPPDVTPPTLSGVFISDDATFLDTDLISQSRDVRVKIKATDPASPGSAPTSGVKDYCLVSYSYSSILRIWIPEQCTFKPLPAPEAGTTDTFIVPRTLQVTAGVQYVFAWVRDAAGNVSRTPAFDVITYIPTAPINLNRNNYTILRFPLQAGQSLSMTVTPLFGDVDVSVFDDFTNPASTRCAVSANNGLTPEQITLPGSCPVGRLQVEIRAAVNSRFTINVQQLSAAEAAAAPVQVFVAKPQMAMAEGQPLVAGPPLRSAIEAEDVTSNTYMPLLTK